MTFLDHKQIKALSDAIAGAADFGFQCALVWFCLTAEVNVIREGVPEGTDELMVGRVLGLLDAITLMILAYRYQSNRGSRRKDELLASSTQNEVKP